MVKYVALLRGINVGGKNKIKMVELKRAFEETGYGEVITYINSGNVLFTSDNLDKLALNQEIQSLIKLHFSLDIPVSVISATDLTRVLEVAPSWWNTDSEAVNYVIFLIPPISGAEVLVAVGEPNALYEKIEIFEEVIFLSAPRQTYTKSRWSKIASSTVNQHVTIRNANTVNKLRLLTES